MKDDMGKFCARLGADPLLVQGAGGNVSWKEGGTLWVTASGTCLGDGDRTEIFVPVDQYDLERAFGAPRGRRGAGGLQGTGGRVSRPSIETWLHGVVPHRVVAHLHAVEALAILVRRGAHGELTARLNDCFCWEFVEYHRPGARLAEAVAHALRRTPGANVIFLRNHGLIVAGDTIDAVEERLANVISAVKQEVAVGETRSRRQGAGYNGAPHRWRAGRAGPPGYVMIDDAGIQSIAHRPDLYRRLSDAWALYPDHVVFLGAGAHVFDSPDRAARFCGEQRPLLIFVRSHGVFAARGFGAARRAQLRCWYDVLVRQKPSDVLVELTGADVEALVHWEAERYRRMTNCRYSGAK